MRGRRRDIFSKAKRSEIMSHIRSKNSTLDSTMAAILSKSRLTYEVYPRLEGNPDFLVGNNVLVFCDSSFWHGRNWARLRERLRRGNNPTYWTNHILKNRRRDRRVTRKLSSLGYAVVRLWDKDVFKNPKLCLDKIRLAQAK